MEKQKMSVCPMCQRKFKSEKHKVFCGSNACKKKSRMLHKYNRTFILGRI